MMGGDAPADPMAPAAPPVVRQRIRIPKSALSINGESPADGDPIEASFTGRVVGSGDTLEIELETVNGEDAGAGEDAGEDADDDMAALEAAALASMTPQAPQPKGGPY